MSTEHRPWGSFTIIGDFSDCKIKRIQVLPQQRLSLQSHFHRQEHWIVLHGSGKAIVEEEIIPLFPGTHVHIPTQARHRLMNDDPSILLEIIEIQTGNSFEESDIIRYQDDYQRETLSS